MSTREEIIPTREEMWEEFESQLKREVRTPITMSYDESIRLAEMGIRDVVARWKKRLEQEPCDDYEVWMRRENGDIKIATFCNDVWAYKFIKAMMITDKWIGFDTFYTKERELNGD